MRKLIFCFLLEFLAVNAAISQTLQTVTGNGDTTNHYVFITGNNNIPSVGIGLGLEYVPSLNLSAIESRNLSNGAYQPLVINGTTVGIGNRVLINGAADDGVATLQVNGPIDNNSGLNNNQDRPPVSAGTIQAEIRGVGLGGYHGDDGFLRLSAGGGTNSTTKSYIDLSGYTYPTSMDRYENIVMGTAGVERMRITSSGNVGIGTTTPADVLTVITNANYSGLTIGYNNNNYNAPGIVLTRNFNDNTYSGGINWSSITTEDNTGTQLARIMITRSGSSAGNKGAMLFQTGGTTNTMYLDYTGNVGIGTTNPQSLLAVNGTITGKQVTITQTGWPDFVFKKDYPLQPLPELEKYIHQHKHLPDIPSSKEVESKGLNLGDMEKRQMRKVEELTLYQIESEKEIALLKKDVETLKEEISQLKNHK